MGTNNKAGHWSLGGYEGLATAAISQATRDLTKGDILAWFWLYGPGSLFWTICEAMDYDPASFGGVKMPAKKTVTNWVKSLDPELKQELDEIATMLRDLERKGMVKVSREGNVLEGLVERVKAELDKVGEPELGSQFAELMGEIERALQGQETPAANAGDVEPYPIPQITDDPRKIVRQRRDPERYYPPAVFGES